MVIILYLQYIQNGVPKLLLMAQPLKHPQSESDITLSFTGIVLSTQPAPGQTGFNHKWTTNMEQSASRS